MMQVQIVAILKYCRCSFSGRIIQSGLMSLIHHPAGYLEVVKYHFSAHAKTCHYVVFSVTTIIGIFNFKEILKNPKAYFSELHEAMLT